MEKKLNISIEQYNQCVKQHDLQYPINTNGDNGDDIPSFGDSFLDKRTGNLASYFDAEKNVAFCQSNFVREIPHYSPYSTALVDRQVIRASLFDAPMGEKASPSSVETPSQKQLYWATLDKPGIKIDSKTGVPVQNENHFYAPKDAEVVVNGIRILASKESRSGKKLEIPLFFDGKEHPEVNEAYVSFDMAGKKIIVKSAKSQSLTLGFEGNYFVPHNEDSNNARIILRGESTLILENREQENFIPKIILKQEADSQAIIDNGFTQVLIINNTLWATGLSSDQNFQDFKHPTAQGLGLPFEIIPKQNESKQHIIQTIYGEIALVEGSKVTEGHYLSPSSPKEAAIYRTLKPEHSRSFNIADFKAEFPKIDLIGIKDSRVIKWTMHNLRQFRPSLIQGIKKVRFLPVWIFDLIKISGFAWNGVINLPRTGGFSKNTFKHEAGHLAHWRLGKQFKKEWLKIAGDVYKKGGEVAVKSKALAGAYSYAKWKDGTNGARYGCVEANGVTNWWEDVASYLERFSTNETIEILKRQIVGTTDSRYQRKLKLLLKHDLISQQEYDQVFERKKTIHKIFLSPSL